MSQHIVSTNPEVIEKIRTEADYFERNAERMRYNLNQGFEQVLGQLQQLEKLGPPAGIPT